MKKGWQAAAVLALFMLCGGTMAPSAAALELDLNGIYEHPVRVAVGVVCLLAALALLLYRALRNPVNRAKRSRSYGAGKPSQGASVESYRKSSRKNKEYGKGIIGLLLPSYKGRRKERTQSSVTVAVPERRRTGKRHAAAPPIRGFSNKSYRGGGSVAEPANLRTAQPDSYREPWGGKNRYGRLRLQWSGKRYRGGGSAAEAANLRTAQPDSYREPWGGKKRYGGFSLPAIPLPYFGRKKPREAAVPKLHEPPRHTGRGQILRPAPAKVSYAEPERYRERLGLRRRYGVKNPADEIPIYRGGNHVLRAARVALATPPSYREPWGSKRRYGNQTVMDWLPVYRGGASISRSRRSVAALPLSYREPWGSKSRYGKGTVGCEPPLSYREPWGRRGRYGREPTAWEMPLSYREPWGSLRRYGAGDPLERTARPERPPYLGGSTTTAKEPWINPETGQLAEPVKPSAKQYGNRRYGGKLYGGRMVHYHGEEPLDSSTVLHDGEDDRQGALPQ